MALPAAIAMIGGTVMSAMAQQQQAKQQAKWLKYNAALSKVQGTREAQSAAYAAGQKRREGQRFKARQLALYGKAGVDPGMGSPLLLMMDTAIEVERDARLTEIRGGQAEQYYAAQAAQQRGQASDTRRAGNWAMGTTLLTGIGSTALSYASYKQALTNNTNMLHSNSLYKQTNKWLATP